MSAVDSPVHAARIARALWARLGAPDTAAAARAQSLTAPGSAALAPLRGALAEARRQGGAVAVIHLASRATPATADGSQDVRDMLSLLSGTRPTDRVLRLGGGEVVVVLTALDPGADVEAIALRLQRSLRDGVHAGVARFPKDGQTAAELLQHAAWALCVAVDAPHG